MQAASPSAEAHPATLPVTVGPLARFLEHFKLETARATLLYWLGLGLVTSTMFISKLLPCVDYPQHLALAAVAKRLADPDAPEHATYTMNLFTYNGLFHILVAKLAAVMPIEVAGRLVVAASLLALGAAVLALVRTLGRPPSYAAVFTPIVFSFSVGWGFANYTLAMAIMAITLVAVARALKRPTVLLAFVIAALGLLCAFAHVLAMLVLCVTAASLAPELAWRSTSRRPLRAIVRAVVALAPLIVGCWFCIAVYRVQYGWDPGMYRDPTIEGTAPPLWQKIVFFGAFATDLHFDRTDQVPLLASFVLLGAAAYAAYRAKKKGTVLPLQREASPPLVVPFVVAVLAYLATPMVLIGTHLIFPRLAQGVLLTAVLAAPAFAPAFAARARTYALAIGLVTGVSLVAHTIVFAAETDDASRVIDELPEGRRATAVVYDPYTYAYRNGTLVHLAAYYAARKHGEWAFAFARYLSVPVRFKKGGAQPAWPEKGWEFDAWQYNPRCKYARAYDLAIVKSPDGMPTDARGEPLIRRLVFGPDADKPKLLSHHGAFWAFDTAGLPEDGTM